MGVVLLSLGSIESSMDDTLVVEDVLDRGGDITIADEWGGGFRLGDKKWIYLCNSLMIQITVDEQRRVY